MDCIICRTQGERCPELWPGTSIVRCPSCRHTFWNGNLTPEQQKSLYSTDYFKGAEYSDYCRDRPIHIKNSNARKREIKKYKSTGRVLEIGSAYGYFLEVMKSEYDVIGFEACAEAAESATKRLAAPVISNDFLEHEISGTFDVACMWDVIEHLPRPDLYLQKIHTCLGDEGYLFLTTGDLSALVPKRRGRRWRLVHPPTHVHYFEKATISRLLQSVGFHVVKISHVGMWRSVGQFLASVFGMQSLGRVVPGAFYLNLYDIMLVVAQKEQQAKGLAQSMQESDLDRASGDRPAGDV